MFWVAWKMLKDTVFALINDEVLSRGAAIAFIVIAIAGLALPDRPCTMDGSSGTRPP
jgi:hypothetical protein